MKKIIPVIMLITSLSVFGQIPSYYNDVNLTLNGSNLKDELSTKIISTHNIFLSYTPGVWNTLKLTDIDPTDPSKVLLIYGWNDTDSEINNDRTRGKDQNGGNSGDWNREHVYPKSLGNPNLGTTGAGADAHSLRPCDGSRNSSRSNRKFAAGNGTASYITPEGNWYPGDEWKGDVARMMMYMYLRYGNQTLPTNVGVGNIVATDPNMIDLFLQWNTEDPVSDFEKQRNPILEQEQGNRNPFIDNPAFATQIWGGPQAEDLFGSTGGSDTQSPSTPSNLISSNITQSTVDLAWTASTDNIAVSGYRIYRNGAQIATSSNPNYTATALSSGTTYSFYVSAYDAAGNISGNSNTVTITTQNSGNNGGGNASDLLISEYIEGSSYNKAIEIANFTGSAIDLSSYSLRKVTNGSGSFSSVLNLSGQLANGQVYVIGNNNASTAITNVANITENSVTTFNGNDAIGLFKNEVLIDLIGNQNSSATFAQDVTLRRKSTITAPNNNYTASEWDSFSTDTFSGLGTHTMDTNSADTTAPTTPSGLIASNITQTSTNLAWTASTDNIAVTGYDVYRGTTKLSTVTTTNYTVTGLIAETNYSFSVRAIDAAGNTSNSSNIVNVTTLPVPDTTAPTTPSGLVASNTSQTSTDLAWTASTDNIAVTGYDVYQGNTKITTVTNTNYTVNNLTANTNYNFSVKAVDEAGNISNSSNVVSITTLSEPSTNGTLIISEYIEGSSNNKAIEIANVSGTTVNLAEYSLRKATNGSGSFSSILNLSGQLANGDVYVIANSNANSTILNVADITEASITTFNGNDAIGLFKNEVLLDLIGNPNSSANFAQDVTLQRTSNITSPNTTYTISEWDVLAVDTFDGLGNLNNGGTNPTGPVVISESYFESGLDNWSDGGSDVARYSGARSYEGSYSIRLRDNSGTASAMTSEVYDLTTYNTVEVDFYFYSYSMENGEDFWLRYYDGSSWQTVEVWARGTDFDNNTFYNAKVVLSNSNYNFTSNAQFRFQADASTNSDHIYIDQVTIKGTSGVLAKSINVASSNSSLTELGYLNTNEFDVFEGDFKMYPNPVTGNTLNLRLQDSEVENITYRIISLLGQEISKGYLNSNQIQVNELKTGVYILEINDGEEIMTQKFIKK
ncbi:endonuclease [Tenacibaculum sp. ZS6-P6]|uniref:endonuclease n=1 Tax=Tenacibaculum sp. ZS6-P6 TaxID=3447503 RepID=UPI003F9C66AF